MATTRNKIVSLARSWIGLNEKDGSYKKILDSYNKIKPLPRGHKMNISDEWCAATISALAYETNALDIIPAECSCNKMIDLFKALGCWVETDDYTPSPGDILFYDWDDKKNHSGDNQNRADHVGIVETVVGNDLVIIEGNKKEKVDRRPLEVDGRYIRGYGVPKYIEETKIMIELSILRKGSTGEQVKTLQRLLIALGYKMTNNGKTYGVDGSFGTATHNAVIAFQKANKLTPDGIVGEKTWNALLK